jgi:hypothetical protein
MKVAILALIQLQAPDHHPIWINPNGILELHDAREEHSSHFAPGAKCLIEMRDGGTVQTGDDCNLVISKIWVNHP